MSQEAKKYPGMSSMMGLSVSGGGKVDFAQEQKRMESTRNVVKKIGRDAWTTKSPEEQTRLLEEEEKEKKNLHLKKRINQMMGIPLKQHPKKQALLNDIEQKTIQKNLHHSANLQKKRENQDIIRIVLGEIIQLLIPKKTIQ